MDRNEAAELLNVWFVKPLELLKKDENGRNAGWVALMVTFPLYERWAKAKWKANGPAGGRMSNKDFFEVIREDLKLRNEEEATIFWKRMRDGILHQAMPQIGPIHEKGKRLKADKTRYILHPYCSAFPVFGEYKGRAVIYIDPWKFADRVIQLLQDDLSLMISASADFPLATVESLDEDEVRNYCPGEVLDYDLRYLTNNNTGVAKIKGKRNHEHEPGT